MEDQIEDLAPEEIEPPHEVKDEAKLADLIASMRAADTGWVGRPLVVFGVPGSYQAITGSHRLAAAREVMNTIPCVVLTDEQVAAVPNIGHLNADWIRDCLRDAGHEALADLVGEG